MLQVINYERDIKKAKEGDTADLIYKKIAGFNEDLTTVDKPDILQEDNISEDGSESSFNSDQDGNGNFL